MKFCPECGRRFIAGETETTHEEAKEIREKTIVIERAEPTYYSDGKGVRITPTRLIIPGKTPNEGPSTYAMANITSIKTEKREPNRWGGIVTGFIGLVVIVISISLNSAGAAVFGVVLLGAGIAWAVLVKPTYHLKASSASGETDALSLKDGNYITHVATAINEALIKQG